VGSVLRITQPTGTLSGSNGVLTTSGTAGQILLSNGVAYATIGTTDWAGMDATNTWIAPVTYTAATDTSLSGNATRPNGTTTLSSNTTITSLRMTGASSSNVTINAGSTLTTGGILMSSDIVNRGTSSNISGPGSLRGPAGQDLVVLQYQGNFDNFPLFISAPIVDNVSATGLTYFASFASNALTLTGSNTYTGVTRILGGVLQIGSGGTTGSLDPSSQIVNNGSLTINRSDNLTFSNSISGTGTLTKSGAGAMLLTGNNTYSGNTTVNAGTLQIGADTALGSSILVPNGGAIEAAGTSRTITTEVLMSGSSSVVGSQDLTFASNFIQASGSSLTLTNNLVAGKKLTINGNVGIQYQNNNIQTLTFSGTGDTVINGFIYKVYSRAGNLSKSGTGTLTLSGASANTYDGLTTVTGGTLALAKLNGATATQAIVNGGLTVGGADNTAATVQYAASTTNPDMMGAGVVTLNGRGILDFNGATDTIGNVAIVSTGATGANPTPIINTAGGGNLTIGTLGITPVAGFTSVVNAGTGTLTLGGDVTFNAATTGQAQISGTALSLGAANRNFIVGLGTSAGPDLLIDAPITGVGRALTKSGAGRLTLANTNTYSGATTITAGTLQIGNGGATGSIPDSSPVSVSAGAALAFNRSDALTYGGTVSGAGGLIKDGAGTTTLTAANTYTGATTINQGILAVSSTGSVNNSSAVTINGGNFRNNSATNYTGALTFTSGTISGTNWGGSLSNLTIGTGQIISPGNSPGTAVTGDQTWAAGGSYTWEINSTLGTAGADPGWDLINGSGTLSVTALAELGFSINVTSLTTGNASGAVSDFDQSLSYNWLIADFAAVSGFSSDKFTINTSSFSNAFTGNFAVALGNSGTIGGDNTQVWLTYTAIPEPKAALLGGLGLLLLLRRRREK
jgi:autotransporter-associated beta strand protein